jgi:hypothetical protein
VSSKKIEKGSPDWVMLNDLWVLHQKYFLTEDADEYWSQLIADTNDFLEKHKDVLAARQIATALIEAHENEYRRMKDAKKRE